MTPKEKILDRAQKFVQKGSLDKAIAEYAAAMKLDPKDTSIRLRMGDLYVKTGKKKEAIKEYTEAAKATSQRGFYLKAIAVWKQILKLDPTNLDVHNRLADLYSKQGLMADAVSEYSYIVTVFEKSGKTQETLELLKKMIDIDPENIGVRLKLADLQHRLSYKNDALAEYAWIFDKLVSQGKYDKAEKIYLGLERHYPGEAEVFEKLAGLYKALDRGTEFYRCASRLLDIHKGSGDTESAKATCESILEVRPNDAASLEYLSRLVTKEGPSITAPSFEDFDRGSPSKEDTVTDEKESPAAPKADAAPEAVVEEESPEEIEISLEGFGENEEEASKEDKVEAPYAAKAPAAGLKEPDQEEAGAKAAGPVEEAEEEIDFDLGVGDSGPSEEATEAASTTQEHHVESEEKRVRDITSPVTEGVDAGQEEYVLNEVEYVSEKDDAEDAEPSVRTAPEETAPVESPHAAEAGFQEHHNVEPAEIIEPEAYVEPEEDLSTAISELMEKMEPGGAEPDEIIEEATEAAEEEEKEDYVDLSAELGMEDTVKDLAESWGKGESEETFDEFKDGIGQQLNKEDSETHYNLGIAYMEMELYGEAVKEFKIALKDVNLEFDCYTRLGLCHMAQSEPDDAILSYLKGLRVQGRSDEERRGMMYELALAYELTGKKDLAHQLFKSIYEIAPDYREVSKKLKAIAVEKADAKKMVEKMVEKKMDKPLIPLDDGLVEVELL